MSLGYFEGWYYKHQALNRTLAVIPGRATDGAFVQVITDSCSYNIPFPHAQYCQRRKHLQVGKSVFSSDGIHFDINDPALTLRGELRYQNLAPIKGNIMGPFRFFPMECRHGIISMRHDLSGSVELNGEKLNFNGGIGYIETDRGRSFPKSYAWVQANDFERECSVMASVAEIPFMGLHFRGCVCVVLLEGCEYRLATYKGVKILRCEPNALSLSQGLYRLEVLIDKKEGCDLNAPQMGSMNRVITETAACPAYFLFMKGDSVLFEGKSYRTSHEYAPENIIYTFS